MSEQEIIQQLQQALNKTFIGGNHLASNLIGILGGNFHLLAKDHEEARQVLANRYPQNWIEIYEQWCCWKAIMEAREIAGKALAEYRGGVLEGFK